MGKTTPVRVGTVLWGSCGDLFVHLSGRGGSRRVEAIGADWVVLRAIERGALPEMANVAPEELEKYTIELYVGWEDDDQVEVSDRGPETVQIYDDEELMPGSEGWIENRE